MVYSSKALAISSRIANDTVQCSSTLPTLRSRQVPLPPSRVIAKSSPRPLSNQSGCNDRQGQCLRAATQHGYHSASGNPRSAPAATLVGKCRCVERRDQLTAQAKTPSGMPAIGARVPQAIA